MPPSFIPRKEAAVQAAGAVHAKRSVFFIGSIALFVLSLLAALGVFFYQRALAARLVKMNGDLVAARAAFEPEFIKELERFDRRLEAAKALLAGHEVASPLFKLLERETLSTVRFTSFTFSEVEGSALRLELKGEAAGFNAVALQSDIFSKDTAFKSPAFSDFDVDKSGRVHFAFTAEVAREFALYRAHLAEEAPKTGAAQGAGTAQSAAAGALAAPAAAPASAPASAPAAKPSKSDSTGSGFEGEVVF